MACGGQISSSLAKTSRFTSGGIWHQRVGVVRSDGVQAHENEDERIRNVTEGKAAMGYDQQPHKEERQHILKEPFLEEGRAVGPHQPLQPVQTKQPPGVLRTIEGWHAAQPCGLAAVWSRTTRRSRPFTANEAEKNRCGNRPGSEMESAPWCNGRRAGPQLRAPAPAAALPPAWPANRPAET